MDTKRAERAEERVYMYIMNTIQYQQDKFILNMVCTQCAPCTVHFLLFASLKICFYRATITISYRKQISFARLVLFMSLLSHFNLFVCQNGKHAVNQTTRNENSLVKCKMRGPQILAAAGQFSLHSALKQSIVHSTT